MEQHTWPSCSDGRQVPHAFSSISSSDYSQQRSDNGSTKTTCHYRHFGIQEPYQFRRSQLFYVEHFVNDKPDDERRARHPRDNCKADREKERHSSREHSSTSSNDHSNMDFRSPRRFSSREMPEPSGLKSRSWAEGSQVIVKPSCLNAPSIPNHCNPVVSERVDDNDSNFSALPFDVLSRVAGSFSWPNLWSASRVCRAWSQALAPLREAMLLIHVGKQFKHGRGGVSRNLGKALDSFLKGAVRGSAAAMVDAGLLLWDMGRREEGIYWHIRAAELGDPAGQCNLGLAYLQDPSNPVEAVKWFHRAALAGHARAQYSLALCLQQGRGVEANAVKAACWYMRAAEGGIARAMYNLALLYSKGEGIKGNLRQARRWMKCAALAGHRKAQFEHGLTLFAEGDGGPALVFLELATRAGETTATHLRDALLQQLSPKMRAHAIACADKWQAQQDSHP